MSRGDEVAVVRALAEVSEKFRGIAARLRSLPNVRTVTPRCWMRTEERVAEDQYRVGRGDGFRVEWYADAEFADGAAISFGQELSWHEGEWAIDASIRANDALGERVLVELPHRYATDPVDLVAELRGQTRLLQEHWDEGIRLFSRR